MRIAMIQMPVAPTPEENILTAEAYLRQAAEQGADLAVLPEMFCCHYSNKAFVAHAQPPQGPVWTAMSRAARKYGLWLIAGSIPEQANDRLYNTSFVFDPHGEQVCFHRKMHLFDVQIEGKQAFRESDTFTAGKDVTVFDTPFGTMGLCICFDMRFPELSRLMALKGARVIFAPAAFNMTTGPAHWELLFRQRAVDNQLHTVGVAPARDRNGRYVSYANSILCGPWGDVLARAGEAPEMIVAELDLSKNESIRQQLPLLSARRTDVYSVSMV